MAPATVTPRGAAAGEVVEDDEGIGVRPMQIVEDQHDRGERLDQRDQRLERVDPARNRSRRANAHLGEDERKRREVPHVHRGGAEHLSQCQRDRRVRDARHELAAAGPPDGDALQLARRRLEQRRLADAELTLDQHESAGAVARCLERPAEEPELVSPAEQARGMRASRHVRRRREGVGTWRQADRLAPADGGAQVAQRVGDRRGFRICNHCTATVVQRDCIAVAPKCVQGQEAGVVAALVEWLDCDRPLGVRQRGTRVAVLHRCRRGGDCRVDHASLVAPALVHGPVAVRLVGEHRSRGQSERVLEVAAAHRVLGDIGQPDELVEAREVELVARGRQGVGLVLGRDQATALAVGAAELAAQHRDVGLEGGVDVHRQRLAPDEIREAVLRHGLTAGEHEQLEQLLRLRPAEISRSEGRRASRHRDAPEEFHFELAASHVPRSPQSPLRHRGDGGAYPSSGLARV